MDKNEEVPVTYEIFKVMSKGENWREIEAEEKRMNDLLKEWQERLGLQSWKIDLRDGVKQTEFQSMEQQGECEYDTVNSCAVIRIAKPEDCTGRILPFDKEKTLVHELLHIKMWFIYESDCDLQSKMVHQLIDDMARALVDAKRHILPIVPFGEVFKADGQMEIRGKIFKDEGDRNRRKANGNRS